jgi:hypothetical protein
MRALSRTTTATRAVNASAAMFNTNPLDGEAMEMTNSSG